MKFFIRTQQLASSVTLNSLNEHAKAPWNECLLHLDDTISLLNDSISSSSYGDSQTWLSAAVANHEACKDGFIHVNAHLNILANSPFMTHSIHELLSNAVAINKAALETMAHASATVNSINPELLSDGYPSWVSIEDKNLIRSQHLRAYAVVVAQDGSGNYRTISEAVEDSTRIRTDRSRFVIHVKAGIYDENVQITRTMVNLMMVGAGIDQTIVTGSKNALDGASIMESATVGVDALGFMAQDMTFENTAGPEKQQAVAIRVNSDHSIFYRCSFKGYQDTLFLHARRQFYRECDIYGTIDFIFGDATAVFQGCNIYLRKPLHGQENVITAQGRSNQDETTGISIMDSNIAPAEELGETRSYLGRPWKMYSRTVIMTTSIDGCIDPAGWLPWSGDFALDTLYYGEYENRGAGSCTGSDGTCGRVNWGGYHVMSEDDVAQFTVDGFFGGASWIAKAGVPYSDGL